MLERARSIQAEVYGDSHEEPIPTWEDLRGFWIALGSLALMSGAVLVGAAWGIGWGGGRMATWLTR